MFRGLYYWLFFYPDIRNANGLMRFGERCINSLLGRARRRSANARNNTLKLESERESIEEYLKGIQRDRLLKDNEYFGIRKKVQTGSLFIAGIFITECLLAYYSTLVLISGTEVDTALLRWLLAAALTLGAITTSERLLESYLPQRYRDEDSPSPRNIPVIVLWTGLLLLVMLGVVAVAEARVRDIEGGRTGSIVYYGFIALSTVLPLIAGTIAWEISGYYDIYKQTRRYRRALRRLDYLASRVGQNGQREKDSYSDMLTTYWNRYNDFRTFKENFDLKHRTNGSAVEAPSFDFEEFKRVSAARYSPVVHDRRRHTEPSFWGKLLHMPQVVPVIATAGGNAFGPAPVETEPVKKPRRASRLVKRQPRRARKRRKNGR